MDYILAIGVDKYIHLSETPFSENDAMAFNKISDDVFKNTHSQLLLGNKATYKNIEHYLETITNKIDQEDRFILFYAGHGNNFEGSPYLSPYDASPTSINTSWINLEEIIKKINSKGCNKSIYFIDACESTIKLGSRKKRALKLSVKELKELFSHSTHSCVFSASSHKGVADVMPDKKHGIWSYYLLQALSGNDPDALNEHNWLTNHTLQNYLSSKIKNYCKGTPECSQTQNAYHWGKEESEFLIAEFPKKILQYKEIPETNIKRIKFIVTTRKRVNDLSGFKKGMHTLPKYYSSNVDNFIHSISSDEIDKHINEVSKELRILLNLKRKDYCPIETQDGKAVFSCIYFSYSYEVSIDKSKLDQVIFTSTLVPHDVNKLLEVSDQLDDCFPDWFDYLLYDLPKQFNINELIDKIEQVSDELLEDYEYDYDTNCTFVKLFHKPSKRTITIKESTIKIHFKETEDIPKMLDGLKEISNQMMLISSEYKMLE